MFYENAEGEVLSFGITSGVFAHMYQIVSTGNTFYVLMDASWSMM